ncbi:MAG: hypothetical protein HQL24_02650 [Candidatus Omnitrophica bacterium]|nr:hypothetical protein [Candidatus Omnitrophota bacterium]
MAKKTANNNSDKKNLVQQVCFKTGRAVARVKKMKTSVKLDKVASVSKVAWEKTKTSSLKIGKEVKEGAVDIAKSFQEGFYSIKKDPSVSTRKKVEDILEGSPSDETLPQETSTELPQLAEVDVGADYAVIENVNIDEEIEKIDKEIKEIDKV